MEKYVVLVLYILFSHSVALPPSTTKQYRSDYAYNKKTDAFYKLHTETQSGRHANSYCQLESAQLLLPTSHQDFVQVHAMFKQFPGIGDYAWIGDDGQEHESAEEQPVIDLSSSDETFSPLYSPARDEYCDAISRSGDVRSIPCFYYKPFVCKVKAVDAPYDEHCGVYGTNYTYVASVGSCYRIPEKAYSWNQAYGECLNEGAHLVVINSEAEDLAIKRLMITAPEPDYVYTDYFLAGFRTEKSTILSRKFTTIFNQTLEEAGFSQWSPNEPNNRWGDEYCGSINRLDGKLNDITCNNQFLFICEKEVLS